MKKLKEMKPRLKITLLLVFVIGSFVLSGIPKTYSRFVSDGALVYTGKLYNMYTEYNMVPTEATLDKVKFEFTFIPNKAIDSSVKEWYEIVIPDACTFDQITTNATNPAISKSSHKHTIVYEAGTSRNYTNIVSMTCTVNPNNEYVEYSAKINEVLVVDNRRNAYIKYNYKEKYTDYLKRIEIGVENPKVIPNSENIYDIFIKWITAYAKSVNRETEILAYIKSIYKDKATLTNPNNFNALLGFKIDYNSATDEYTFTILENFVGYARTYYAKPSGNEMSLYFSTTDRNVLNEAFKNYLNLYVYPGNTTAVNNIYKYVTDKQGIYSVIFYGNKNIKGLSLVSHDEKTLDTEIKLTKNTILSGSNDYVVSPPQIDFQAYKNMLANVEKLIGTTYSNISLEVKRDIFSREDVQDSITKNCKRDKNNQNVYPYEPVAFTDYFVHENGNQYILIKIASDGKAYNTFELDELSIPSSMNITFENIEDNKLKISISDTTKDTVMDMVTHLNTYFKTNITESDVTVTGTYKVEYTITK